MSLNIGTNISHYHIIEKLGEGGMGVVYKAEDTKLKRTVALKFLPPELTRDTEAKARFIREAQAASTIQHNNICTIHEINETDNGQTFMCMDYYHGETLKEKIVRGTVQIDEAINIVSQIANGLDMAHKQDIIHRDIKPANIMITDRDEVKILDFGLAKLKGMTLLTKTGTTMGAVAYMSPEQACGDIVDHRSDIWSLGVVLYEMLTGHLPFKGEYEQAIIYSIMNLEPEPIEKYCPDASARLNEILKRTLEKDPQNRYQSVYEVFDDIQRLNQGKPTIWKAGRFGNLLNRQKWQEPQTAHHRWRNDH